MIHQYKSNGYAIVLDVNSGSVHVVDDIVYDCIALLDQGCSNEEVTELGFLFRRRPEDSS